MSDNNNKKFSGKRELNILLTHNTFFDIQV